MHIAVCLCVYRHVSEYMCYCGFSNFPIFLAKKLFEIRKSTQLELNKNSNAKTRTAFILFS